ncbi:MAG: hypothetical protein U0T77_10785 [Chitinophagales bacterium]
MPTPINIAQMKSLIDQTFNQKYGIANSITPIIEGDFMKTWVDFNAAQYILASTLSNVNNTSDMDKPVSTAQSAANAVVLASAQSYADSLVIGLLDDRGNYDASGNLFPATGGSGASGAIKKGDIWTVSVAGTLGSKAVSSGDTVRALVDAPGQTSANWAVMETNFGYTPLNAASNLSDLTSASSARTNLGLGSLATLSTATPTTGGTGLATYTTGDIIYASATNVLSKLAAGTNGHVLTLAGGVPTWAAPSGGSSGWGLTGNSGTVYGTNYIGTSDNVGIQFKTNGTVRMFITSAGIIGAGASTSSTSYFYAEGNSTGNPATGYSFEGYGAFITRAIQKYAIVHNYSGNTATFGCNSSGQLVIASGSPGGTTDVITINNGYSSGGDVGIGGSPVTGAKLAIVSTSKVFLPTVMTAANASAISSIPRGGMTYVTDTNGTFTSAGWWGYNGSTWKLICAD